MSENIPLEEELRGEITELVRWTEERAEHVFRTGSLFGDHLYALSDSDQFDASYVGETVVRQVFERHGVYEDYIKFLNKVAGEPRAEFELASTELPRVLFCVTYFAKELLPPKDQAPRAGLRRYKVRMAAHAIVNVESQIRGI